MTYGQVFDVRISILWVIGSIRGSIFGIHYTKGSAWSRGTLQTEKPPVLGMIQRSGEVIIKMLANMLGMKMGRFYEVYVNTMEGFWSLLRSWLRPHRGISQEKLPTYLSLFEFIHNARKRGKSLLASLVGVFVS